MITIGKAKELLRLHRIPLKTAEDHELFEAIKLGVKALERVEDCRDVECDFAPVLLEGEAKEGE